MKYKIITGNELERYYEVDADTLEHIISGKKRAAVIHITDAGGVEHALMDEVSGEL